MISDKQNRSANISEDILNNMIAAGMVMHQIIEQLGYTKSTIMKYMRAFSIKAPKGFYREPGKKVGRPKGAKLSPEHIAEMSMRFSGEGNPFFGKKHSSKTKEKMARNHADFTGDKNPFKRSLEEPAMRQAHRDRCKTIWNKRDADYRREFSEKLSKSLAESSELNSQNMHKRHRSGFYDSEKSGRVFYRSSWELSVCQTLASNDKVKSFALEPYAIPYVDEKGSARYTRVDFVAELINGKHVMIEVKPKAISDRSGKKIEAYRAHCEANSISFVLADKDVVDNMDTVINRLFDSN